MSKILIIDNNIPVSKQEVREMISGIESTMKECSAQLDIPISHHFSKDVYAREMVVPEGTLLVGKIHKFQNLNILSEGEVSILSIDGCIRVKAPYTFIGSPGSKRLFYMHSKTTWTTIHGTSEQDVTKIEDTFIAKNYDELYLDEAKIVNEILEINGDT